MARLASTMKAAFGRWFRDRQILIRSDQGVRHLYLRQRHQLVAFGTVAGLVCWGVAATLSYVAAHGRATEQEAQILDLEIGYARLITDLASSRTSVLEAAESLDGSSSVTRHVIERNNELQQRIDALKATAAEAGAARDRRSEEHTSELQSLMRNSYAVFCLKKKKKTHKLNNSTQHTKKQKHNNKDRNNQTSQIQSNNHRAHLFTYL